MARKKVGKYANISGSDGRRKRKSLLRRDGNICWICGESFDLDEVTGIDIHDSSHPRAMTLDHIITRKDGGTNKLDNLKLAHRSCNGNRSN